VTYRLWKCLVLVATNAFSAVAALAAPPSGASDVVGRDLYITGLGFLGHLGIYTSTQQIVQAMDAPVPIHLISWNEFATKGGYWGARYMSFSGLFGPATRALEQRAFKPQYTTSSSWQAGKYDVVCVSYFSAELGRCATWQNVIVPARFRCDTLVIYAYLAATGVNLTPLVIAPRTVFYALPGERLPYEDRQK
jgi:hypothetical protein